MEELYDVLCCHTGEVLLNSVTLTAAQEYTASRVGRRVTQSDDPPEDYWVDIPEVAEAVRAHDEYIQSLRGIVITNRSQLTGVTHTRKINVSAKQIELWEGGALIQDVMPHLSDEDREFLMTGITPEEWDAHFGEEVTMDRALGG